MTYRHEVKHIITEADKIAICHNMNAVAKHDKHVNSEFKYVIRSLYFDNVYNKALHEKQNGLCERDKFRIRYYDGDLSFIALEKKSKIENLCLKRVERLTVSEVEKILAGDTAWMATSGKPLLVELYCRMKNELLRPRVIVDYERIPYIYEAGNVRVTLDYNIRSGFNPKDFLNPNSVTVPTSGNLTVLEVKWSEYLPAVIRDAVQLKGIRAGAFSKYEAARIFG